MTWGNVLCMILYLITEFVNYLLMYLLIFQMSLNKKRGNWIISIFLVLSIHLIIWSFFSIYDATGITFLTMLVIPIFLIKGNLKKRFALYLFVIFAPSSISSCITFLLSILYHIPLVMAQLHFGILLSSQCVPTLLFLVLVIYSRKKQVTIIPVYIGKMQLIFYGVGAFCIWWMIGGMQALCQYDMPNRVITVTGCVTSIACVIFVFLLLWQGIVAQREIQLKEQIRMNENIIKLQEEHFRQIIVQDEKIRRLRHDMQAHMMVLRKYCENKEYDQLTEYILYMTDIKEIEIVKNYTGNQGVDAVLNYLIDSATKEIIEVEINASMFIENRLTTFEICTILFNLIQNAIEACRKIPVKKQRIIQIEMLVYENKQYIRIRNTVDEKVKLQHGTLYTTKLDRNDHGFGIQNVVEIVKEHNGTIEFTSENMWFEVQILI